MKKRFVNSPAGQVILFIYTGFLSFSFQANADSFFIQAARFHITAIQAGKLAVEKGNAEVQKIGRQMVTDHTVAENELVTLAKEQHQAVYAVPDDNQKDLLDNLKNSSGKTFDSLYMAGQFAEHKNEVALYSGESQSGTNQSAKEYAGKYLPKMQMHLQMFVGNSGAITTTMDSSVKKK